VKRDYIEDGGSAQPNRREFIRRGALALGLTAWTVPLVQMVRTHSHGSTATPSPEQIGVQAITASCTTCVVACESITQCGTNGVFICFCAPVPGYPMATCACSSEVICEDAILCSDGCPPGWACAQGCCPHPVCLPPCPADPPAPLLAGPQSFAAAQAADAPTGNTVTGKRLTVAGRYV
jgi:hypothetical protein